MGNLAQRPSLTDCRRGRIRTTSSTTASSAARTPSRGRASTSAGATSTRLRRESTRSDRRTRSTPRRKMAPVRSCCCGCTLESGCVIIAMYGLIGGIIELTLIASGGTSALLAGPILSVLASSLLLWGTIKKNHAAVLAYLVVAVIDLCGLALGLLLAAATGGVAFAGEAVAVGTVLAVLCTFWGIELALGIYFWIVAFSFFSDLKESGSGDAGRMLY